MGQICSSGEGRVGVRQRNRLGKGMEVGQDAGGYKEGWKPAVSEVGPDGEGPARWMASAPRALRLSWASLRSGRSDGIRGAARRLSSVCWRDFASDQEGGREGHWEGGQGLRGLSHLVSSGKLVLGRNHQISVFVAGGGG